MIEIREILENEIVAVAELEQLCFPDPWSEKSITDTFHQKNAIVLGAFCENVLAGYVIFYYVLDEGEIARIATTSSVRRTGAATRIMEELKMFCLEKNIERVLLDVRESNAPAIAFYRKSGFAEDGIRKNFYENPAENAVLMSMDVATVPTRNECCDQI